MATFKGTSNAPRTKDGKEILVFPTGITYNAGFDLRSALEGRIIWEVLKCAQNDQERMKRILEKDPKLMDSSHITPTSTITLREKPEGLLDKISIPHVGLLKPTRKIGDDTWEADEIAPPYAPIEYQWLADESRYEFFGFPVVNMDSHNLFTKGLPPQSDKFWKASERNGTLPRPDKRVLSEWYATLSRGKDALKDERIAQTLRDMARYYVFCASFRAQETMVNDIPKWAINGLAARASYSPGTGLPHPKDIPLGECLPRVLPSQSLAKTFAQRALALSTEYAAEMK